MKIYVDLCTNYSSEILSKFLKLLWLTKEEKLRTKLKTALLRTIQSLPAALRPSGIGSRPHWLSARVGEGESRAKIVESLVGR